MSGDTVVIGAVTITRADIDAIAGGRAALSTVARSAAWVVSGSTRAATRLARANSSANKNR